MEAKHGNFHRIHMHEAHKNERRQVNQKFYRLKKGEHIGMVYITPPLYRCIGAEPNVNTTASTGMLGMSFCMYFM